MITDVLYYATRMRMLVFKCCRIGFRQIKIGTIVELPQYPHNIGLLVDIHEGWNFPCMPSTILVFFWYDFHRSTSLAGVPLALLLELVVYNWVLNLYMCSFGEPKNNNINVMIRNEK